MELDKEGKAKGMKIIFWNVADLYNKEKDFQKFVSKHDYISLYETWIEEKGWDRIKGWFPETHVWECSFATKENRKERAKGGFVIGKKKTGGR